jgi:hypothetical protein
MKFKTILAAAVLISSYTLGIEQAIADSSQVRVDARVIVNLGSPYPLFYEDGEYYRFHQQHWYRAPRLGGPWLRIEIWNLPPTFYRYRDETWAREQRHAQRYYWQDHRYMAPPNKRGRYHRGDEDRAGRREWGSDERRRRGDRD